MKPKLFVPFNVKNQIINENCTKEQDISDFDEKLHYSTLLSYIKESRIYNAFMKRSVDGYNGKTKNFGLNYDNFRKGLSDTVRDVKYTIEHPYSTLNCGFIINPYRFAVGFSDTGLKAYWKYNEASGNIINLSESAVDLGSGADAIVTGATYGATGQIGDALDFDGVDDHIAFGTSTSQFNFMHNNTNGLFHHIIWYKADADPTGSFAIFFDDCNAINSNIGITYGHTDSGGTKKFNVFMVNGAGGVSAQIVNAEFTSIIPDFTNWHMYSISWDFSLGSDNFKLSVDDGSVSQANKIASRTPSNSDSTFAAVQGRTANTTDGHLMDGQLDESSIWNDISTSRITSLYGGGSGLEIY